MATRRNPLLTARWNQLATVVETVLVQVHPRTLATKELMEQDSAYFELFPEQLDQLEDVYLSALEDQYYLENWRNRLNHIIGTYRALYGPQGGIPFDSTYQRLEQVYQRLNEDLNLLEEVV